METEKLLEIFNNSKTKILSIDEIKKCMENSKGISKTIDELVKKGILFKTKTNCFGLSSYFDYKVGEIISANKKGVVCKLEDDSTYFISEMLTHGAIYRDKVLVTFNKYNCVIIDVIEEYNGPIVGEVFNGSFGKYIKPINVNFPLVDLIGETKNLVEGHIVSVIISTRIPYLKGEVEDILGHKNDPDSKIKAIARDSKVNLKFDDDVLDEVESLDYEINEFDRKERINLTNNLIVTIDGKDAKDLDDAIEVEKIDDVYKLSVHIADVSHYVKRYSKIDKEALKRGTSIYLTDFVIPMLPHALCNNLCSLNPNEEKLVMSVIMTINKEGEVIDYDIKESIIKSKYRLNYDDTNKFFNNELEYPSDLAKMLNNALELSNILKENKIKRGEIDLDIKEPEIILNDKKEVIDIKVRNRGKAERLIEDFMIVANETVASHIYYQDLPFIYRVHEEPKLNKFDSFNDLISHFGYKLKRSNDLIHPLIYQDLLNRINDNDIKDIVRIFMLRSMSKARYDANNLGHFGLASTCYTHFTSPIRRYPDLLVHRLLKLYMHKEKYNIEKLTSDIVYIAELSSNNELKALELERKIDDIKMAEYMSNKIGTKYIGKVVSIINSGFFVQLDNLVEGMVRFDSLLDDYYVYDESNMCAIGEKSKKVIKYSDKIEVEVIFCDVEKGKIDFIVPSLMKGKKKYGKQYKNY